MFQIVVPEVGMPTSTMQENMSGLSQSYDQIGIGYADRRQQDPDIARALWTALEDCQSVLNVGAGAGSYEPVDRFVVSVSGRRALRRQCRP